MYSMESKYLMGHVQRCHACTSHFKAHSPVPILRRDFTAFPDYLLELIFPSFSSISYPNLLYLLTQSILLIVHHSHLNSSIYVNLNFTQGPYDLGKKKKAKTKPNLFSHTELLICLFLTFNQKVHHRGWGIGLAVKSI